MSETSSEPHKIKPSTKSETEKTQQPTTRVTPDVILNANDRIYLAVSQRNYDALFFVYMLVAKRTSDSNQYKVFAETEIAAFQNQSQANIYAATLQQIIQYQQQSMPKLYEALKNANWRAIANFKETTK